MLDDLEKLSWKDVRDKFRKWRENNERRSEEIIHLWDAVLEYRIQKTGNEKHLILEQVIIAALDTERLDTANECIEALQKDFPDSLRVAKFKGMGLEAVEEYDKAIEVFDLIIKMDESNPGPRKRKIAILKTRGRRVDAIKELCEYVKKFMSDQEAWHELCNLYLAEGEYSKAAFCMEEVLLHNPHSHLIHQRIAEIRYTMGGMENIEIARTYYCQAIKLNPNNLRALYGLYLCCIYIGNSKALGSKRKDAQKLGAWALEEVSARTLSPRNNKFIAALEVDFNNLDIKSN